VQSTILPKITVVEETEAYGKYSIEPLEKTYGITMGNALRRVLLSNLPGLAIVAVRIKGASHEFSTLEYMKEDVLDFILNLKQVRIRKLEDFDKSLSLELEISGQKEIKAGDIKVPSQIEIINPDLYLCSLTNKKAKFEAEFVVEEGYGYSIADARHYSKKKSIDYIPIDALFSPVRKANFQIDPTRVGEKTDAEKMILEVETDQTLSPMRAINLAAAVLTEHFTIFVNEEYFKPEVPPPVDDTIITAEEGETAGATPSPDLTIEDLGLSTRVLNSLHGANIDTVADLVEYSEDDLLKLKNFGQKSMTEIREQLAERQLSLKGNEETA